MGTILERNERGQIVRSCLTEEDRKKVVAGRWWGRGDAIAAASKDELARLYLTEQLSLAAVGQHYGVTGVTASKVLRQHGIPLRTKAEQTRIHNRQHPAEFTRFRQAGNAARAGKSIPEDILRARAVARQEKPAITAYEQDLLDALRALGLDPIPQYAFDRFNIDLAFPDQRLAIEVGMEVHRSPKSCDADRRKRQALAAARWTLIEIPTVHIRYNAPSAATLIAGALAGV